MNLIPRKFSILIGLTLLLSGCASQGPGHEAILNSWIGQSENDLVAHFGIPRRSYENRDGSRVLEIVRYWSGAREYPCRVTFSVSSDGRVTGYKWVGASAGILGNACAAPSAQPAFTVDDMR